MTMTRLVMWWPAGSDCGWKEYIGIVSIPDGTKKIVIGLQIYGPVTVWFDEVTASYIGR